MHSQLCWSTINVVSSGKMTKVITNNRQIPLLRNYKDSAHTPASKNNIHLYRLSVFSPITQIGIFIVLIDPTALDCRVVKEVECLMRFKWSSGHYLLLHFTKYQQKPLCRCICIWLGQLDNWIILLFISCLSKIFTPSLTLGQGPTTTKIKW